MNKIIITILLISISSILYGQNRACTDVNTFWLLHDVSGSMKIADPKRNSVKLLSALQQQLGNEVNLRVIYFGEKISPQTSYKVSDTLEIKYIESSKIKRGQKYSNINEALEYVKDSLDSSGNNYIYLITDGELGKNDISTTKSLSAYKDSLQKNINRLTNQNIPIFTFQTNYCSKTDYIENILAQSYINGYYYVDSRKQFKQDSAFSSYIDDVHIKMLSSQKNTQSVKISKMMVVSNSLRLLKSNEGKNTTHTKQILTLLGDNAEQTINYIDNLLTDKSITRLPQEKYKDIVELFNLEVDSNYFELQNNNSELSQSSAIINLSLPLAFPRLPIVNIGKEKNFDTFEETVIIGVTDYLIKRSEDELFYAYFENLHNGIFNDNSFVNDTLFYNTNATLDFQHKESYDLILLTEALNKDFDNVLESIMKHPAVNKSEQLLLVKSALGLINNLYSGNTLLESAMELKFDTIDIVKTEVSKSISFIADFASHLKHRNINTVYLQNKDSLEYLSLFLFAEFANEFKLDTLYEIQKMSTSVYTLAKKFNSIETKIKRYNIFISSVKKDKYNKEEIALLTIELLKEIIGLMDLSVEMRKHFSEKSNKQSQKLIQVLQNTIDASFALKRKEYSKATMLILPLLKEINFVSGRRSTKNKNNEIIIELINLAGLLSTAKTTDDITAIIKTYAVPSQSYRQKRVEGSTSLFLNSYVGVSAGYDLFNDKWVGGLFAPVGIELSHGYGKYSFGVFVSALDFGNPMLYRLGIQDKSKFTFEQLLSPGAYITVGCSKKSPFSGFCGVKYISGVWNNSTVSYQVSPSDALIASIGIALDLPLYRLK